MLEMTVTSSQARALPMPRVAINIRPGVLRDVPFLDSLQKLHTKQVGWMPTKQLEEKIRLGHVLIAEERETTDYADNADNSNSMHSSVPSAKSVVQPLGYCIGNDQYFKRDDIEANYFWESLGFVPLAFRSGSAKMSRMHIFWQRRIGAGDTTTPYRFLSQTTSGAIREDRLVLPIRQARIGAMPSRSRCRGVAWAARPWSLSRKKDTGGPPVPRRSCRR
jgi:hypothetical protein